jgi:hypothetical protein
MMTDIASSESELQEAKNPSVSSRWLGNLWKIYESMGNLWEIYGKSMEKWITLRIICLANDE